MASEAQQQKLEAEAQSKTVVAVVDAILVQAFQMRASDVHIEPTREVIKLRFRIDGVMEDQEALPKKLHQSIISRIKILGNMDVAERRVAQDGRVRVQVPGKELDLRIATYPTIYGEAAAIRLLTKDQLLTLEDLGLAEKDRVDFADMIIQAHGIILVTGPTGSGKSTTLYASLLKLNRKEKHILSVEDPVEQEIADVDQTQINLRAGVTFASSIRAMMRQDPDIIMVGEIRDQETADTSFRAAMTGHLVFSTLHANTAIGAISRLVGLGIEPYLISSSLLGVLAQRLVRRLCQHCKEPLKEFNHKDLKSLRIHDENFQAFKAKGCPKCRMKGFHGRVGIFELAQMTEELRELINEKAPEPKLRECAETIGFKTMVQDGVEKIRAGLTTVEEVRKVASDWV